MDRHVRWFRREVAAGVAQRLAAESLFIGAGMTVLFVVLGSSAPSSFSAGILAVPAFVLFRISLALTANPLTSAYLLRWPHPASSIAAVKPTSVGTPTDTTLKQFRFALRGAFDEWGGATTNLYTMDSDQIIVTTSEADDIMAISALGDRRLVVTTTQMLPPHERLIINRVATPDVRALLTSHLDLIKRLIRSHQAVVVPSSMDQVIEVLAIEWDAWDRIGPVLGPFVQVGQRRQPTLLQVDVSAAEILRRTSEAPPIITARGIGLESGSELRALTQGKRSVGRSDARHLPLPATVPPSVPPTQIERAA